MLLRRRLHFRVCRIAAACWTSVVRNGFAHLSLLFGSIYCAVYKQLTDENVRKKQEQFMKHMGMQKASCAPPERFFFLPC